MAKSKRIVKKSARVWMDPVSHELCREANTPTREAFRRLADALDRELLKLGDAGDRYALAEMLMELVEQKLPHTGGVQGA